MLGLSTTVRAAHRAGEPVGTIGEDVNSSLIMIQPTLMLYIFDVELQAVLFHRASIKPDVILLLSRRWD
jgi:hypothetical protein